MAGNTFGTLLSLTTFGESHGQAVGGILDGIPAGMPLEPKQDIQPFLDERKPGTSHLVSPRGEPDEISLYSGLLDGQTTGTPIGFWVYNQDARSKDYAAVASQFRPGHADYTYQHKYGLRDPKGGGRASARETLSRVVGGAIARKWLQLTYQVQITAGLSQVGPCQFTPSFEDCLKHRAKEHFCTDPKALQTYLDTLRASQDSCGGQLVLKVRGLPIGWGEPVFDRLGAALSAALMSIPAAKAIAIGDGFDAHKALGSQYRDPLTPQGFTSNHAGGMLGGISNGDELVLYINFKPTSSLPRPIESLDHEGQSVQVSVQGRHDPCVAIRAVPIVEAMAALTLADLAMWQRARGHH